jgi:hypothetical protein
MKKLEIPLSIPLLTYNTKEKSSELSLMFLNSRNVFGCKFKSHPPTEGEACWKVWELNRSING